MLININSLRWYKSCIWSKYPHLTKRETFLWSSFLAKFANKFNRIAYDVTVRSESPEVIKGAKISRA